MKTAPVILIVDDKPMNIELMEAYLGPEGYRIVGISSGEEALTMLAEGAVDLVLLDIMMPGMNGFEVVRGIRQVMSSRLLPIILVTSLTGAEDRIRGIEAGCDEFISRPVDRLELLARIKSLLKTKAYNDFLETYRGELETEVNRRIGELARSSQLSSLAMIETVSRLAPVAEHRYGGARDHIGRMSRYTAAIASRMGVDREGVETILLAAAMHDLGMVCIPGSILGKPGTFDAQERLVMQGHAELGAAFLAGSTVAHVRLGEIIARHHHENWDGSGYPAGLAGEDIPLEARMAAVADRFDALTSSRPWRPSLPLAQAMEIIRGERERRFDPEILDAFLANHEEIRVLDQGSEGWDRRGLPGPATDGSTGS